MSCLGWVNDWGLRFTLFSMKKLNDYIMGIKNEPGRVITFGNPHSCRSCTLRERPVLDEYGRLKGVWVCSKYPESECAPDFHCVSYAAPVVKNK